MCEPTAEAGQIMSDITRKINKVYWIRPANVLVNQTRSKENMAEPWIVVQVGEIMLPCIVDSGAVLSIMDHRVYEILKEKKKIRKEICVDRQYRGVNGDLMAIHKQISCRFKIIGFAWDHKFLIMQDTVVPVILGMDFILKTRMEICPWKGKFSFWFNSE